MSDHDVHARLYAVLTGQVSMEDLVAEGRRRVAQTPAPKPPAPLPANAHRNLLEALDPAAPPVLPAGAHARLRRALRGDEGRR